MISDYTLTPAMKVYKAIYGMLRPFIVLTIIVSGFFSMFEPQEGSKSRIIAITIFVSSLALFILLQIVHKIMGKSYLYRIHQPRVVQKIDPSNLVPLIVLTILTAFPFYLMLVTSIKNPFEANAFQFSWWPKDGPTFAAYKELFSFEDLTGLSMWRAIVNSFVYAIVPTLVGLFTSALAAYAFAKIQFKGRKLMYNLLIMTMLMPGCVTMATSFIMFDWYGWVNTPLPLIIPGFFGGASTVMFLREYFMGIPNGLLEAARIDGAGRWKAFFTILLPLARPALMAQFVLGFISAFNNYMGPLIYLNDPSRYTIQVAIDFINMILPDNAVIAASGVLAIVPMLLLYIIFQKKILSGISMSSGLKG